MLTADHVSFGYDDARTVLSDVSVEVPAGGLVGVLGPNGSGKTTFLKLLAGLLVPTRGCVRLDGADIAGMQRRTLARRVAVVPQETELAFDYTVLDIVLMGRYPHLRTFELEGPDDIEIARRTLAATGTTHLEQRTFRTLSGGEKQRVIIASALAQFETGANTTRGARDPRVEATSQTRVLFLDEPTSSLDLSFQLATAALVDTLNRSHDTTVVVCTHDLNFAAALCRDLVVLRDGQVIASGPTETVLTPDTIGAVYDVRADVRRHPITGHLTVVPLARL
ncbi:MAG: ABC transporter ATP-binding protein [Acidobacteria bacterium]|nr:ABC transporter ATP-binding protein [Acidobacteriota bacterium]